MVVVDLNLPNISGIDVIRQLGLNVPGAAVLVPTMRDDESVFGALSYGPLTNARRVPNQEGEGRLSRSCVYPPPTGHAPGGSGAEAEKDEESPLELNQCCRFEPSNN